MNMNEAKNHAIHVYRLFIYTPLMSQISYINYLLYFNKRIKTASMWSIDVERWARVRRVRRGSLSSELLKYVVCLCRGCDGCSVFCL